MTIYVCGDSTAAAYTQERAPITGWGQLLEGFLPGCRVVDAARGGRSTKSFLSEGRLQALEKDIQPGDLLLIQFTHNDTSDLVWRHTDPHTSFVSNLSIFVDTARLVGATPVLMTPIPRRYWRDGQLLESHDEYPDAIRRLAMTRNVPLIDIYREGTAYIRAIGEAESAKLYMNVAPGLYPAYPDGQKDDTHTCYAGAEVYARMTAQALMELKLIGGK